jgi:hypothetical protein
MKEDNMSSFQPPLRAFQSEDIAVLQQAFDAVWSTIVAHRPSQAATTNCELW